MTDYVNTFGAATKDATNAIIAASDIGTELDNLATAVGTKADKIVPSAIGNVALLTSSGNLSDAGKGVPTGAIVGTTDTQTLTNKTLTFPTIDSGTLSGSFTVGATTISDTEISYLDALTGNIQTQIDAVLEGDKHFVVSDTSNLSLADVASSYTAFGSPFSVDIPASGVISALVTGRLVNNTGGGNTAFLYAGIRIGTTNYWLGQSTYVASGGAPITLPATVSYTGTVLNDYTETLGIDSHLAAVGGLAISSITAHGIPTGTQTVQLIVSRGSAASATLAGATTTSYFHLKVEGGK